MRLSSVLKRARSFLPAAEPEWLEARSWALRPKVRSFLRALNDDSLADASAHARAAAVQGLEAHAAGSGGVLRGQSELQAALESARQHLLPLQKAPLCFHSAPEAPTDPSGVPADAEAAVEKGMRLPHRKEADAQPAPGGYMDAAPVPATPLPGLTPTAPPDPRDLPEPPDQVFDAAEQLTLASLRVASVLQALPMFWDRLLPSGERFLSLRFLSSPPVLTCTPPAVVTFTPTAVLAVRLLY